MDHNRQNKRRQYTEKRKKDVKKIRFTLRQFTIRLEKNLKSETNKKGEEVFYDTFHLFMFSSSISQA